MVIRDVNLETVCGITSTIPDNLLDEVAFAGKSNVGKSSLINALLNRKALARTSSQPGKTQTINFYLVNGAVSTDQPAGDENNPDGSLTDASMYLVDLPGYGYASVSETVKESWGRMIERYLRSSKNLRAVFLLIDIRHEPSGNDRMMYEWILSQGYQPIVIATKADKLKRSQIQKQVRLIRAGLDMKPGSVIFPFSATSRLGRDDVWNCIDTLVLQ